MDHHHHTSPRSFAPRRSPVCGSVPFEAPMRLSISSTTGSRLELSVPRGETVEGLRRCLSQKLRVPRDRIVLLHKERQLSAGKLLDQGVTDDSKITLVPTIEAGLATSKTERNMMQALESLTEAQVSDFLSGRAPLTLALGIGAHMMYVQLQLAAQNVVGEQQQPQKHTRAWGKTQPAPTGPVNTPQPGPTLSRPTPTTIPSAPASPYCQTSPPTPHSLPQTQPSSQGLRTVSDSTAPSSNRVPVICNQHGSPPPPTSCPPHSSPSDPAPPALSVLTGCPHPSSPLLPAAPLCSPHPTCASSGPLSPAQASTVPEDNSHPSSPDKEPGGAVIESLVNHSPGVFSGTFSGTLPPVSQNGLNHPRRGIAIILQILNDLLSATRHHQGAPNTLSQLHCPAAASNLQTGLPLTPGDPSRASRVAPMAETTDHPHLSKTTGEEGCPRPSSTEENVALRRKLEHLHLLMHQRRLHRRTRRAPHPSRTSHPYQQRHARSWSPRRQRVTRCQGDDSLPTGTRTSPDGPEMEVVEESPWKPELTSDLVVV